MYHRYTRKSDFLLWGPYDFNLPVNRVLDSNRTYSYRAFQCYKWCIVLHVLFKIRWNKYIQLQRMYSFTLKQLCHVHGYVQTRHFRIQILVYKNSPWVAAESTILQSNETNWIIIIWNTWLRFLYEKVLPN